MCSATSLIPSAWAAAYSARLKTLARGEIREFSDVFNHTRHAALDRVVGEARRGRANAVVGIRTTIQRWAGTHEMMMAGTAAFNPALPASAIVTSDLTGEELWALTSLGYAPIKLLMSTSIYSLGLTGGFLAAFKSFRRGEINELTRLVHDAREIAIDRLKSEADQLARRTLSASRPTSPRSAMVSSNSWRSAPR